jgi:hypothetical protein
MAYKHLKIRDLISFACFIRERSNMKNWFISSDSKKEVREMAHRCVNYYLRKKWLNFH